MTETPFTFDELTRRLLLIWHPEDTVADLEALITAEKADAWTAGYAAAKYDDRLAVDANEPLPTLPGAGLGDVRAGIRKVAR